MGLTSGLRPTLSILAAVVASAGPALAQSVAGHPDREPILLRLAPAAGQVSHYRITISRVVEASWLDSTTSQHDTALSKSVVLEAAGDTRRMRLWATSTAPNPVAGGVRGTVTFTTRGAVVQADLGPNSNMLTGIPGRFPEHAVQPGDTWAATMDVPLPIPGIGGTLTLHLTMRLERSEVRDGARLAVVTTSGHGAFDYDDNKGLRVELKGETTSEGTYDLTAGRVVASTSRLRLDGVMRGDSLPGKDLPFSVTSSSRTTLLDSADAGKEATAAYRRARASGDYETMRTLAEIGGIPPSHRPGQASADSARALYRQMHLSEALPLFADAVLADSLNADNYAWLAETARRLGDPATAARDARAALTRDSCHAFAHTALADAFNPQYGDWDGADADSSWAHLLRAAECDPRDGNVWVSLWVAAMARGRSDLEERAMHELEAQRFFAPSVMAFGRWTLRWLPPDAVLLVSGDLDYFPLRLLQQEEGLRNDVVVAHAGMLNAPWYPRRIRDRYGIALPIADDSLESFESHYDVTGKPVYLADSIIRGWTAYATRHTLGRPLVAALTTGDPNDYAKGQFVRAGPYWSHVSDSASGRDTALARRAFAAADIATLAGPLVSAADRSPVRATGASMSEVVLFNAFWYAHDIDSLFPGPAYAVVTWAERAAEDVGSELAPYLRERRATMHNRHDVSPAANRRLQEGEDLAREGKVREAIRAYAEAASLDTTLEVTASSWDELCWWGSLWQHGADVMFACNNAVAALGSGSNRDSRGIARAETGDFAGAADDFEAYVAELSESEERSQRLAWIEALRAGRNPFTPKVLEALRR